jgi:rare lipoprotein A (peptidoglycan hydrolase)
MTYMLMSLALLAPAQARHCDQLFTPAMGERAANAVYRGTRHVTRRNLRMLGYIERCQQHPRNQASVRTYDRHLDATHKARLNPAPVLSYATASWYDDAGNTASGFHAYYGVANKYMAFGTRVLFVYHGRSVEAIVDDRGPYIAGRDWDLNQNTAGALGFGGVDTVGYHIGG